MAQPTRTSQPTSHRLGASGDKLGGYFVKEVETSGVEPERTIATPGRDRLCTITLTR